jgi:hypothetical protein
MNAAEVLTALTAHDANVVLEGDRVRVIHPAGNPPPPDLIAVARQYRDALRAILEGANPKPAHTIYAATIVTLRASCPAFVDTERWHDAIRDTDAFMPVWGERAEALGWTARDLFALHTPPEAPARAYSRMSRLDATGMIWLLNGRPVVAMTANEAAIQGHRGVTMFRKTRTGRSAT